MSENSAYARHERFTSVYERCPEEALSLAFSINADKGYTYQSPDGIRTHLWCSYAGMRSPTRYGSYKYVTRKMLEDRKFSIQLHDYYPGIMWLDCVHDERQYKPVPIEMCEYDFESLILSKERISNFNEAGPFIHEKRKQWPARHADYVF